MKGKLIAATLSSLVIAGMAMGVPAAAASDGFYAQAQYGRPVHSGAERLPPSGHEGVARAERVNARQDRQLERIRASRHDDRLSRSEFNRLMREQKSIRRYERQALDDRFMSRQEFNRLSRLLDRADAHIRHARQTEA